MLSATFGSSMAWLTGGVPQFVISRWIFLRLLGVISLIAFISLSVQITGLVGSNGILPVHSFLQAVKSAIPGIDRFRIAPTLLWFSSSDAMLKILCALGVVFSITLILGIAPSLSLLLLWILYLSLVVAGQEFLSFQWDILLLETLLLAIMFAPQSILPGFVHKTAVPRIALLLLWWLLFRLMFESGIVKLTSGDSSWWNLTALRYHYETQPLPTWIGWYVHQLPDLFQRFSVFFLYVVEIVLPFFILGSSTFRAIACAGFIALQILIFLTGNYTFFNLLSIALSLLLLDDAQWRAILPSGLLHFFPCSPAPSSMSFGLGVFFCLLAIPILLVTANQLLDTIFSDAMIPPLASLESFLSPLRSFNSYGLFRVMTRRRDEIIVEGSDDGVQWLPYEFRWKPGALDRALAFVEPHQPRLDWQMWFAALSPYGANPWFQNFLVRLLQGSPDVLALLGRNPFPDHPPRFIRAEFFRYHFTTLGEHRETGNWWKRESLGMYAPAMELQAR